jgi:hypothetical protein
LRDAFQSAEAVFFGDRYYVTNATTHVQIYVVDCAERDPIMVFVGFKPVADTILQTLQKVKFIDLLKDSAVCPGNRCTKHPKSK